MGVVNNTYPPASLYNRIPFIHDMEHVAKIHADDLNYLRGLLDKHSMPTSVCIKLIHIHFHLNEGEILAMREIDAPPHGKIPLLEPTMPDVAGKVYGCNYIVDGSGDLQAFEYTTMEGGPDLATYPSFVTEFCAAIVQRGLQHKFGLAINLGAAERGSWMELDYPDKRATFLLPSHIPLPQSDRLIMRTTITKFPSFKSEENGNKDAPTHVHIEHVWGSSERIDVDDEEPVDGLTTKNGLFRSRSRPHQDVVPVEEDTLDEWTHPPFEGYYDQQNGYLYGRGTADDKSALAGVMSALEALLAQEDYDPRRNVILAFGYDRELSGERGAGAIVKHLVEEHGEDGIDLTLDEGGARLQQVGDRLCALPAVYEKGYLDVWFNLSMPGGDSFIPPPHSAVGVMAEIVKTIENNPFDAGIEWDSPVHQGLTCFARYSPHIYPELTERIQRGDFDGAARLLARLSSETQYYVQISQAVDLITGGEAINTLPESVTLGVSHGLAPQDTIGSLVHSVVELVQNIVNKYNLRFEPFEDDDDYDFSLKSKGLTRKPRKQGSAPAH
ncbi:unnamed protein product [Fusarium equiseti]|uniref:Uncharacterized protein n=1 Tax=Fusarium equiseti TaxID=61235 RepID=A0A8J2IS91_FUSEQ|nr:unnamed protein product [Fusarium equiseti]